MKVSRDFKHEEQRLWYKRFTQVHGPRQRKGAYLTPFLKKKQLEHREARLFFMTTGAVPLDVTYFQPDLLLRSFSCSKKAGHSYSPESPRPQQSENNSVSTGCRSENSVKHFILPNGPSVP